MTDPAAAPHINHCNDPGSLIDLYLYRAAAPNTGRGGTHGLSLSPFLFLKKEKGRVASYDRLEPGQRRDSI